MKAARGIRDHVRRLAEDGLHVFTLHDFVAREDHPRLLEKSAPMADGEEYIECYRKALNGAMYYFRKFLRGASPRSARQKEAVFWTPVRIADNVYSYFGYVAEAERLEDRERFLLLVRIAAYLSRGMFAAICMESALYYQNVAPYKDLPVQGLQVMRDAHELKKNTPFGVLVFSRFNCNRKEGVLGQLLEYPELALPVCNYALARRQVSKRKAVRKEVLLPHERGAGSA